MEGTEFEKLLVICLGGTIVLELLFPAILGIIGYWLEYTLRKPVDSINLGGSWHGKYGSIVGDTDERVAQSVVITFTILLISYLGYYFTGELIYGVFVIVGVVVGIFAPRFIIDICKSLKYNSKTGDSDRISKLEKELQSLKENK